MSFTWDETLAVGDFTIDSQHRELFRRVDGFRAALIEGRDKKTVEEALNSLENYVVTHFHTEENMMGEQGFPGLEEHRALHETFKANLGGIRQKLRAEGVSSPLVTTVSNHVCGWLLNHIPATDRELASYLNKAA